MVIRHERARRAAELFASRRDRDAAFTGMGSGFGEPAWDMLLILYIADAKDGSLTKREMLLAAQVEPEIAEPYIGWMITRGLAQTEEGGEIIRLCGQGRVMMDAYLDRAARHGNDGNFMH